MNRSKIPAYRVLCALTASSFLMSAMSCSKDKDITPPGDPECVTPTVTNFVDSAQARVVIKNFSFQPASITIKAGQTVKWKQCGPEQDSHTVTSDGTAPLLLDSPFLGPDETYSKVFTAQGTNAYHCKPHPDMQGTVTVVP